MKHFLLILSMVCACAGSVHAQLVQNVWIDDFCYTFDETLRSATVTDWDGIESLPENICPTTKPNLVIPDSVSYNGISYPVQHIAEHAFSGMLMFGSISTLSIPQTMLDIHAGAFLEHWYIKTITCHASTPPVLVFWDSTHSDGYIEFDVFEEDTYTDAALLVPEEAIVSYLHNEQWSRFQHIYPIGELNKPLVSSTESTATFYWPVTPEAAGYILDVRHESEVLCHLTLEPEANATMSYTLSGLDPEILYFFTVAAVAADDTPLHVYQGYFYTGDYYHEDIPIGDPDTNPEENPSPDNPDEYKYYGNEITPTPPVIPYEPYVHTDLVTPSSVQAVPQLVVSDGQIYLRSDNTCYTITGQRIR